MAGMVEKVHSKSEGLQNDYLRHKADVILNDSKPFYLRH